LDARSEAVLGKCGGGVEEDRGEFHGFIIEHGKSLPGPERAFCPAAGILSQRASEKGRKPVALTRASESGPRACNNLPSRDREGAVFKTVFSSLLD
jgi:hypothetical protein